ncbi:MAG TPA: hypothetical protein VFK02_27240 [Kofleriaceae bacterium]|nr:hypothetical protein [Kofleriaceae bacterium]
MRKFSWLALVLGACVAQPGAEVTNVPRLSANGMTPDNIAHSQLTTAVLDAGAAAAMAVDAEAQKVLRYAAECALAPGQAVSYSVGGVADVLSGAMGIAPGWTTAGLSASEAAWVSACVFSRANASGLSITISDRGAAAGLATSAAELASYQIEEGAFWGNAFVDLGAVVAYSCNGVDQAADDSYGDLPYRECAEPDGVPGGSLSACGMRYAGLCSEACATASPYAGCSFEGGPASTEVVTTFLYGSP